MLRRLETATIEPEKGNLDEQQKEDQAHAGLDPAKGGRARAEKLTPEEREGDCAASRKHDGRRTREIRKAVIAPHNGTIKIADLEMPCSVLSDGTRV